MFLKASRMKAIRIAGEQGELECTLSLLRHKEILVCFKIFIFPPETSVQESLL